MAEILGAANAGTKLFLEVNAISIDNWTFKLFYKATTTLCLACSVVASSKQFFGDPINCEVVSLGEKCIFISKRLCETPTGKEARFMQPFRDICCICTAEYKMAP